MATHFSRTLRALESERPRGWLSLTIAVVLLAAWATWSLYARITLYAASSSARLEATGATYPVAAEIGGRVVRQNLSIGQRVRTGEILVELDAEPQRLARGESQARLDGLGPAIASMRNEIATQEKALVEEREARGAALEEQAALVRETDAALKLAQDDATRIERLFKMGLVPSREQSQAQSEVERRSAAADAARGRLKTMDPDLRSRETDRRARIDRLRSELGLLERDLALEGATIRRLENEIAIRVIRASVDGQVAEAVDVRPGAVLDAGTRVGSVVADTAIRVVAQFEPATSLGRVHPGQQALLRLHGFPSAEYGSIPASVASVADEVRDGLIRVELSPSSNAGSIPLQHGLPGDVVVEVEHVRPAVLLLRSIGAFLNRPVSSLARPHVE